jgi:hypothetical protein
MQTTTEALDVEGVWVVGQQRALSSKGTEPQIYRESCNKRIVERFKEAPINPKHTQTHTQKKKNKKKKKKKKKKTEIRKQLVAKRLIIYSSVYHRT